MKCKDELKIVKIYLVDKKSKEGNKLAKLFDEKRNGIKRISKKVRNG